MQVKENIYFILKIREETVPFGEESSNKIRLE